MKIVDIELGKDELKFKMVKQFAGFTWHVDRVKAKYIEIKDMKKQLPINHALVEIYSCQTVKEKHSAYLNA